MNFSHLLLVCFGVVGKALACGDGVSFDSREPSDDGDGTVRSHSALRGSNIP